MRLVTVLLLVVAASACTQSRYEWKEEPAAGTFEPLPADAPVTIWIAPPPHRVYPVVAAADNPMIGTGPPAAVTVAEGTIVFSVSSNVRWRSVLEGGRSEARRLGGDVLAMELTDIEDPDWFQQRLGAWRIRILRSRP